MALSGGAAATDSEVRVAHADVDESDAAPGDTVAATPSAQSDSGDSPLGQWRHAAHTKDTETLFTITPRSTTPQQERKRRELVRQQSAGVQIVRRFTSLLEGGTSDWRSLWIVNALGFISGAQYSLFFTSIWPYLRTLKADTGEMYFGIVIAVYSLCQSLSSPCYGYWSNRARKCRPPIVAGACIMIIGDVVYSVAHLPADPTAKIAMVLVGRMLMGCGSGIWAVLRAYVATASVAKERSRAISLYIACAVGGLAIGPGFQICFTPLGEDGYSWGPVAFNMYTAPAYCGGLLMLVCLALLYTVFVEKYSGIVQESTKKERFFVLPKFDKLAVLAIMLVWFAMNCITTNTEVIMVPYTMIMYSWNNQQAVLYTAILVLASCGCSAAGYVVIGLTRAGTLDARKLIMSGCTLFLLFHLITYPWPFFAGTIQKAFHNQTTTVVGCDESLYDWCDDMPVVPFWLYAFGYTLLIGCGYPQIASPLSVLYSQILGPRRQGTMQGVLVQVGSMARTLAPLAMTWIFQHLGPDAAWIMEIVLQLAAIAAVLLYFRRLVPLERRCKPKPGQYLQYKNGKLYRF